MRVIGIDPGETTGIVVIEPWEREITVLSALHLKGLSASQWLDEQLTVSASDVVIERFNIAQRTLQGTRHGAMEALYTIGAMRHICHRLQMPMEMQDPSSAKNAFSDAVLKTLGLWDFVSGPHERDALRHALLYARTRGYWSGTAASTPEEVR
jgi:hypothetical protein